MNSKIISEKEIKAWYIAKKTAWKFHIFDRDHTWETASAAFWTLIYHNEKIQTVDYKFMK